MKFRYLTFDCYGTLIDWQRGIENSLEASFGKLPIRGDALMESYAAAEKLEEAQYQKYREVLRKTALRLAGELGLKADANSAARFAASVPLWPAFSDTARALRALGTRGYLRYILSNVDTDLLEETIKKNQLEVDGFVTAEEVGSYKPALGHWSAFFKRTGADKREVIHVAQSLYHDILPAQQLGLKSVWVNRYREPLLPNAHPTYLVDNLVQVVHLLG